MDVICALCSTVARVLAEQEETTGQTVMCQLISWKLLPTVKTRLATIHTVHVIMEGLSTMCAADNWSHRY